MSRYSYMQSKELESSGYTFEALIMGAIRQADSINLEKLQSAFPDVYHELKTRYNAPGGFTTAELEELELNQEKEGNNGSN